jgi:hypothetical protein
MIVIARRLLLALTLGALLAGAQTLRVMSFNVRYPAKTDSPNRWEFRRDLVVVRWGSTPLVSVGSVGGGAVGDAEALATQGRMANDGFFRKAWVGP